MDGADVGMAERRGGARFPLKTFPRGLAGECLGQNFDGDIPVEAGVPRLVHLPHAAGAYGRKDFVGA